MESNVWKINSAYAETQLDQQTSSTKDDKKITEKDSLVEKYYSCFNGAKRPRLNKEASHCCLNLCPYNWRRITHENLILKYARIFSKSTADYIFQKLEEEVEYFSGDLLKVKVYGKWHDIPRKQVLCCLVKHILVYLISIVA